MNRLHSFLFILVAAMMVGCTTTADKNFYKATGTAVTLVDKAMTSWADYVVWSRTQPMLDQGRIAEQWIEVGITYENYQSVLNTVYRLRSIGQPVDEKELTDAALAVFDIVNQFLPPAKKLSK